MNECIDRGSCKPAVDHGDDVEELSQYQALARRTPIYRPPVSCRCYCFFTSL